MSMRKYQKAETYRLADEEENDKISIQLEKTGKKSVSKMSDKERKDLSRKLEQ